MAKEELDALVAEGAINWIVNGINNIIGGFNSVVSWAAGVIGVDWGGVSLIPQVSLGRIPALATGAVIPANKEFLAVLGDQKHGTDIEAPLDTIKQAQKESLLEVLSELGLTGAVRGGNSQPKEIVLKVDRRELGRIMIDEGNLQLMSTGKNMFMLGTT